MASGLAERNEFNPSDFKKKNQKNNEKTNIPSSLLDFEKIKENARLKFNSFENTMIRKGNADLGSPPIYNPEIINTFLSTENGNFRLNTENDKQIVTEQ
jgi:hypothetical protein